MANSRHVIYLLALACFAFCATASVSAKSKPSVPAEFLIFRKDCFAKKDFTSSECLSFTITKGLGYGIIAGSGMLKVP